MQLVETKASKVNFQQLKERLAAEKIKHLSSVLAYKYGLNNTVTKVDGGDFVVHIICDDCGEPNFLNSYSMDEALSLTAEAEAICLVMDKLP